jgi:membrane protease YdiL (CAAX protease family)
LQQTTSKHTGVGKNLRFTKIKIEWIDKRMKIARAVATAVPSAQRTIALVWQPLPLNLIIILMELLLPQDQPGSNQPSAPLPPSPAKKIFYGPDGLRAGWRLVVYLILFFAIGYAIGLLTSFAHLGRSFSPLVIIRSEGILFVAALLAGTIMARWERRPLGDYGLRWRQAFRARFWEGALWGFVAISLLLLILRGVGVFSYGGAALAGTAIMKYGAIWAGVFLLVGFSEEYVFRGYPLYTLTSGISFWPAALLLSAAFGAVHLGNRGEDWLGAFNAAFIGLFFCLTLRRTGSLWFAIGAHMSWDWGETYFYGVPDSGQMAPGHLFTPTFHGSNWLTGGTVGPEGSVITVAVIAAMIVLFYFIYPTATYPRSESNTGEGEVDECAA